MTMGPNNDDRDKNDDSFSHETDPELQSVPEDGLAAFVRSNLGIEILPGRFLLNQDGLLLANAVRFFPDETAKNELDQLLVQFKEHGEEVLGEGIPPIVEAYIRRIEETTSSYPPVPETVARVDVKSKLILIPSLQGLDFFAHCADDICEATSYMCQPGNVFMPEVMEFTPIAKAWLEFSEFERQYITRPDDSAVLYNGFQRLMEVCRGPLSVGRENTDETIREVLGGLREDAAGALTFWFLEAGPEHAKIDQYTEDSDASQSESDEAVRRGRIAQLVVTRCLEQDVSEETKDLLKAARSMAREYYQNACSHAKDIREIVSKIRGAEG